PRAPKASAIAILPRGPRPNATAPKSPPIPNIARNPRSTGIAVASSVRVMRRNGTRTCGTRRGRRRRTCMPPPRLERRRSAVPSTAEPVKTSSSASALIVIASFPEELLPYPILLRTTRLIRRNGNGFPRYGRHLLVYVRRTFHPRRPQNTYPNP